MDFIFRKTPQMIKNIINQNDKISKLNNKINKTIDNSLYVSLANINSKELFNYFIIIILSIYFFNYINIQFKSVFGIIIGIVIAYIIYNKQVLDISSYNDQLKIKLELIKPTPELFINYPELVEFFYSIREFYDYNRDSFTRCINNIDSFLKIYNDIKIGIKYCDKNIDVVKLLKKKALNNLHSVIFNLEDNFIIEKKLKKSLTTLQKILNIYLNDMIDICNKDIDNNGYNYEKSYIFKDGPSAYNTFLTSNALFDLY